MNLLIDRRRATVRPARTRASRPLVEGLEDRLLLYAATSDVWAYPIRVTYSFMPDGTSIGGTPSNLFATLNAVEPTSTWQGLFAKAAAEWEDAANINFVQVSDDGSADGSGNYQQGAPNFGDVRIGAMPLPSGILAETFMPPPANGGSDAGDMIFNSTINWTPTTGYDLLTVALHEFGHDASQGESSVVGAVMYPYYEGTNQTLQTDDVEGVDVDYGARVAGTNINESTATPITLNSSAQAVVTGVQISSSTNTNWYSVVVPSDTSGAMTITMQSTGLSSLEPRLTLYSSTEGLSTAAATTYGGTVTLTLSGVTPGQLYYIRASPATSGAGYAGAYGLNVNLGAGTMPAIAPPYTSVAAQGNQGGGEDDMRTKGPSSHPANKDLGPVVIPTHDRLSDHGQAFLANVRALHRGRAQ